MTVEVSCGAVVFARMPEGLRYVIIHSQQGFYGFPKGHMEAGETEQQTALREIREEVGLEVRLLDGFREVEEHPLPQKPGVTKRVIYFLAECEMQPLLPQPGEVAEAAWMTYDEAMGVFQFDNLKVLLHKAHQTLQA